MRLIMNAIPLLGEQTGVGHYAYHIAEAIFAHPEDFDIDFFYGWYSKKLLGTPGSMPLSTVAKLKKIVASQPLLRRICKKALCWTGKAQHFFSKTVYDCYFEPNFVFLLDIRTKHAVLTAHDLSYFFYPQWHPAERVRYMEKYFPKSLSRADRIITDTETIRQELINTFGIAEDRITQIYCGLDHHLFHLYDSERIALLRQKYQLSDRFILYVGTLEPRKNLGNLLQAYLALPENVKKNVPLVLIGSMGWKNTEILEMIKKHSSVIRLLGYVPANDLPIFYNAASLLAWPSWYEGFGLPVLEAMACGCPVLTSTCATLLEISGEAAKHTPPDDVQSIRDCLLEMLEDDALCASLRKKGFIQAAKFSWEESVRKHKQLFKDVSAL